MLSIKKVLLPTDFSDFSKLALPYAADISRKFGADLYIIHVFDENTLDPYYFGSGEFSQDFYAKLQDEFQDHIDKYIEDVDLSDVNVIPILANGTPFLEIIRYAKEEKMDLVVSSTHGRSGLSHMLMGSTAEKLVRKSPCPVLTVRHPEFSFEMP